MVLFNFPWILFNVFFPLGFLFYEAIFVLYACFAPLDEAALTTLSVVLALTVHFTGLMQLSFKRVFLCLPL